MNKKILSHLLLTLLLIAFTPLTTVVAEEDPNNVILISDGDLTVTKHEAQMMFKDMNYSQRERMSNSLGKFNSLLTDFLIEKKKIKAAKKLKIDQQELVQWKINKSKNRILSDQLITQFRNAIIIPEDINLLAEEYYKTNPKEFTSEETIKVAHILLSTSGKQDQKDKDILFAKLVSIATEIEKGKLTFEEAAKLHSDDKGSAKNGGIINHFGKGQMVKSFEEAAFKLKNNNNISEVIESQFGYHLIKLIDRKNAALQPYAQVKAQLIESESRKYRKTRTLAYSETFTNTENFSRNEKAISDIVTETKKATPSRLPNQ